MSALSQITIEELYRIYQSHQIISTDSRKITQGALFFALKGEHFDGNQFAARALENGAAYAVVDDPKVVDSEQFILVSDTLVALQQLALYHRKHLNLKIIAITGSNGKTTTKELISAVLSTRHQVISTAGNYNNHIGVPLTLLRIGKQHDIAVIEMGANHQGEIDAYCNIALPTHGLITNIGKAHLEGFGGIEGVERAKTELYRYIQSQSEVLFVDLDNPLLIKHAKNSNMVTYAEHHPADYRGENISTHQFLSIRWFENDLSYELQSQLIGSYNLKNILAAICVGRYFEVPPDKVIQAIESYSPSNNRSQVVSTLRNTILLDAYNANPTSMAAAIENFTNYPGKNKVCVLGDMLELGSYTNQEHQKILDQLASKNFETVLLVGENFYANKCDFPFHFFHSSKDAIEWLRKNRLAEKTILIKGSRKLCLEDLTPDL